MGHSSNSPNLGVGALTVSNIAIVEDVAKALDLEVHLKIFQWNDPDPQYINDSAVEVVRLRAALDWLGALEGRVLEKDPLGTRQISKSA